jgi:hypothetical protein
MLNRSGVRLIVLDSCESGRLAIDPFRSMAPALIRAQVPAVVAMQFPVQQDAARYFAVEFYRALVEGFPIDACLTEGRKAVLFGTGIDNANWGIPVAYTRAPDGKLFEMPKVTAATSRMESGVEDPATNRASEASTTNRDAPMELGTSTQSISPVALRDFLVAHFNDNDLRDLCFEIGIEDEDVPGDTRSAKAREIVRYCQRHTRLEDLKAACAQLRPKQWATAFPGAAPSAAPVQPPAEGSQNDNRVAEREAVHALLEQTKQRYYYLKGQEARYGINTPTHIALEIQDLEGKKDYKGNIYQEGEIAKLERRLKQLGG